MIQTLENFVLLVPELMLLVAAFGIVLHSVFAKADKDHLPTIMRYAFLVLLLVALGGAWGMLAEPRILLDGCLVYNRLTLVAKFLAILLSFPFWGMRRSALYEAFGRARLHFYEYTALVWLSLLGTCLLLVANNWLIAYLALELQVIPWYIILAYRHEKMISIESGIKYFVFGSIASAIFLYGLAFIFGATGNISFSAIPITLWGCIGIGCIMVGMLLKLALAPFHVWVMEVYEGADNVQIGYLSTVPIVTFVIFLMRLLKGPFASATLFIQPIFMATACLSIFVGSLGALKQQSIRKLLAYSGITHLGLILLVIGTSSQLALFYLFSYVTATMTLYYGLSMAYRSTSNIDLLKDLNGIGVLYPFLAFSLSMCILSLAGIPPLPGFWAKLGVFISFIRSENYILLGVAVFGTLISFYYYLQFIRHIYLMPEQIEQPQSEMYGHSYLKNAILIFIILFFLGLDKIQSFLGGLN